MESSFVLFRVDKEIWNFARTYFWMKLFNSFIQENVSYSSWFFDNKLTFLPHIKMLKNKSLKALNIFKFVSSTDWGADSTVLLNLYRSLIRSKLDYGRIVYGSARPSYIKLLDTVHHQGLRLSLGAFRTSPVESLYVEANEPSVENRRIKLGMQYATKLKACSSNPAYDWVFNFWYRFRWHRTYCNSWKPSMMLLLSPSFELSVYIL
jgi:hypothetical protein